MSVQEMFKSCVAIGLPAAVTLELVTVWIIRMTTLGEQLYCVELTVSG